MLLPNLLTLFKRIFINMTNLQKIITETINRFLLREYHHTTDNGLIDDCNLIYDRIKYLVEHYIDEYSDDFFRKGIVELPSLGERFIVCLTDNLKGAALDGIRKYIYINKTEAAQSLKNDKVRKEVFSNIYHELGHWIQIQKSDRLAVTQTSFSRPYFKKLNAEKYQNITRKLYCFHDRELKARFYGTYMWLKQHNGENISIQDVYDSYACRLTLMRETLSMLNDIAQQGEQDSRAYIIKDLYKVTYCKNRTTNRAENASFEKQAQRVIYYFTKRYNFFKKGIDKIYCDWKMKNSTN